MSFGADWLDIGRDLGRVAAEILNGESPANIPISQPTKYEMSVQPKDRQGVRDPDTALAAGASRQGD